MKLRGHGRARATARCRSATTPSRKLGAAIGRLAGARLPHHRTAVVERYLTAVAARRSSSPTRR